MATTGEFFQVFPEFVPVANAKATSAFWLAQAQKQLALGFLGDSADLAVYLHMAHNLTLNAQDYQDTQDGGLPGDTLGPISSKAAGGLSVSYDSGAISSDGGGDFNATSYGQRLAALLKRMSAGTLAYAGPPNRPTVFFGWRGYGF